MALATMGLGTGLALYQFHVASIDERKAELQREVDMAASMLKDSVAVDVRDVEDQAQRQAAIRVGLEKLRPLHFGESGYLFALDFNGVARLSPNRTDLEGKGMLALQDAHGGFPFRSLLATAKS